MGLKVWNFLPDMQLTASWEGLRSMELVVRYYTVVSPSHYTVVSPSHYKVCDFINTLPGTINWRKFKHFIVEETSLLKESSGLSEFPRFAWRNFGTTRMAKLYRRDANRENQDLQARFIFKWNE